MNRRLTAAAVLFVAAGARAEDINYKKLYSDVSPAVVLVYGEQGEVGSIGTGSIIRNDGLVVTNAHVILNHDTGKPWEKLFIFLKPEHITGRSDEDLKNGFAAQWLMFNQGLDLAMLRIVNPPGNLPVVQMSDDSSIGVGEATAAIGHPEQGAKWSLTTGRIGGEWSDFDGVKGKDVYQMETSVNRGNSGGPLLDGNGYMVGINTCIARKAADGLAIVGINFAIKSSVIRKWIVDNGEQLAAAPVTSPDAAPPPAAVASAKPAPEAQETVPTPGTAAQEPPNQIAFVQQKKPDSGGSPTPNPIVPISARVPAAPANGKRGFKSTEPVGRILSPADLVMKHAKEAFDDLDSESAKFKAVRGK